MGQWSLLLLMENWLSVDGAEAVWTLETYCLVLSVAYVGMSFGGHRTPRMENHGHLLRSCGRAHCGVSGALYIQSF